MKVSISNTPAQSRQTKQRLASPDESLTYELGKAVQELPPLYTRLLAGAISVLVFGSIAWAYYSKVDEVAIAQGELIPSNQVRPLRALSAGSIQVINVKEGDPVKKGQVLVEMDAGVSQAEVNRLEQSAKLIREDIARLQAERTGSSQTGTVLQDQLLAARLREFDNKRAAAIADSNKELAAIDEGNSRLARLQENLNNARADLSNAQDLLANAQERLKNLSTLENTGAVPNVEVIRAKDEVASSKSRLNEAQDKIATLEKEYTAQQDKIRQSQESYQSALSTAEGLSSQRSSEVLSLLAKRQEELTSLEGQLNQAKKQRERETLEAPYSGTVYNLKATRGPAQPGEELMSVLPQGENVILEVKVLNRDIGFIRAGQKVKVKLATFPFQEFGIVDGEVLKVSPNAIVEKDENGQSLGPVFLTQVRLKQRMIDVHGKQVELTPGMAATGEIVTRQKSVLTFLVEPVTRRFSEAFSVR